MGTSIWRGNPRNEEAQVQTLRRRRPSGRTEVELKSDSGRTQVRPRSGAAQRAQDLVLTYPRAILTRPAATFCPSAPGRVCANEITARPAPGSMSNDRFLR